ncbi:MAG: diaminopropionate ammonia-lyase [bacterium]
MASGHEQHNDATHGRCRYSFNPYHQRDPRWDNETSAAFERDDIAAVHQSIPGYRLTPLHSLPSLARKLGVGRILVKDESHRLGLKAFKVLGSSYAIYRFIERHIGEHGAAVCEPEVFYREGADLIEPGRFTFCTATDGNHGRGVAWTARRLGQKAAVFVPRDTVKARIEAIAAEGAGVTVVDGTYDDAVVAAARAAEKNDWQVISDTSWPGYTEIPRWVMAGYLTLFREIDQADGLDRVDVVIVQGGVGALAAAAGWYYRRERMRSDIRLVAVEPAESDCLLESVLSGGQPTATRGDQQSIMAGLNCGQPSPVAWPLVRDSYDLFLTVNDESGVAAMRTYYHPDGSDPIVVSGESGAAGLAALLDICRDNSPAAVRERLDLSPESTVLLLNTEGDTDPVFFKKQVAGDVRGLF